MPDLTIIVHPPGSTIYVLPSGEIYWAGVDAKVSASAKPTEAKDSTTFQALGIMHAAKDHLPEPLRASAERFVEDAHQYVRNQYGSGGVGGTQGTIRIVAPNGNIIAIS